MSDASTGTNWSGTTYATVVPATNVSSIAHHAAVESVEDSGKVPGRINYPLVVGTVAKS